MRGRRATVDARAVWRVDVDQLRLPPADAKMRVQLRHRRVAEHHVAVARAPDRYAIGVRITRRLGDLDDFEVLARPGRAAAQRPRIDDLRRKADLLLIEERGLDDEETVRQLCGELVARRLFRQLR